MFNNKILCHWMPFILILVAMSCCGVNGQDVASSEEDFVRFLEDPNASSFYMSDDLTLNATIWDAYANGIIVVSRNISITGGKNYPVLDFDFMNAKIQVMRGVTVTFASLQISSVRQALLGSGPVLFVNSTGSTIVYDDCLYVIDLCLPANTFANLVMEAPRPPQYPGQQLVHPSTQNVCITDKGCFPSSLDIESSIASSSAVLLQPNDGYVVMILNTLVMCMAVVAADDNACTGLTSLDCLSPPPAVAQSNSSLLSDGDKIALGITGALILVVCAVVMSLRYYPTGLGSVSADTAHAGVVKDCERGPKSEVPGGLIILGLDSAKSLTHNKPATQTTP